MSKLRAEKLQALIKQEMSNMMIRDVKDPRVKFVTITGVEVSNDLSYAKIYVSLYGSEEQQAAAWKGRPGLLPQGNRPADRSPGGSGAQLPQGYVHGIQRPYRIHPP